jgi:ComF family protein
VILVVDPCTRCGVPGPKPHTICGRCRAEPPPYVTVSAPWEYGGQLAVAIQGLKYSGLSHHSKPLGALLRDRLRSPTCIDWALPVPLHRRRLQQRGFNQAALLAVEALRGTGVKVRFDLIRRTRDTTCQAGLDLASRQQNVRGAFASGRKEVSGSRLLLVDDVMTTGATVSECARTLISAGAKEVHVLTLARAMP